MWQLFLAAVLVDATSVAIRGDHPAVKIIALLQKLQNQAKEEGEAEAAQFSKFQYWCTEMTKEKEGVIKKAKEDIAMAQAQMQALTEDIAQLDSEVTALTTEISHDDAGKTAASDQRSTDNGVYVQNKGDIEGTISAVGDAISALESSKPAMVQSKAVQKALALVDIYAPQKSKAVHAFLQRADPIESANADQFEDRTASVRTYDFKSGGVIEVLKTLKLKFEDDLTDLNKAEANAANSHSLADAAKEDEINAATRAKDSKTELHGAKGQDKAEAESNLESAEGERSGAKTILDETTSQCRTRSEEWDERQKRRAGEIEAMQGAIEVLAKVTGVRTPESKGVTMFLQKFSDPRAAIVNLLRKAGNTKSTAALQKLADQIASLRQTPGSGVFDQIKNMIQKMIFHLQSEQKDEDDHKNWCDMELEKTNLMEEDKTSRKEKFEADIASLTAEIEQLETDVVSLHSQIQETDAHIEEATANRQAEKAENQATIKDAQDAQAAVGQAISVLTDFYKSTGGVPKEEWEAFVQLRTVRRHRAQPAEPELWDSGYSGTGGGTDVIGLREGIASDFATMEAQAKSDETTQQDEYDTDMTDSQISKSEMQKDADMKTARKERLSEKLQGRNADNEHNQKELDATTQYLKDLQHACVDGDSTYADRKAARTQETEALRQAQTILEEAFAE